MGITVVVDSQIPDVVRQTHESIPKDVFRKDCCNCGHHLVDHCSVFSCACATAITNHLAPTRWISVAEGMNNEINRFLHKESISAKV